MYGSWASIFIILLSSIANENNKGDWVMSALRGGVETEE